ncbi:MAG: helix-turn-helix transcriptional regulator [Eubacteriaceae bacterium]|nr:helix-turn-helix transcriptional regulator [Eubacteriaceae bacterium]
MSKEMGIRISDMLEKRNMSQRKLADRIKITEQQLSRYISGDREPKPEIIANMATALQTTSDYLLGLEDGEFNFNQVRRLIARNASDMSDDEKRELMDAIFGKE